MQIIKPLSVGHLPATPTNIRKVAGVDEADVSRIRTLIKKEESSFSAEDYDYLDGMLNVDETLVSDMVMLLIGSMLYGEREVEYIRHADDYHDMKYGWLYLGFDDGCPPEENTNLGIAHNYARGEYRVGRKIDFINSCRNENTVGFDLFEDFNGCEAFKKLGIAEERYSRYCEYSEELDEYAVYLFLGGDISFGWTRDNALYFEDYVYEGDIVSSDRFEEAMDAVLTYGEDIFDCLLELEIEGTPDECSLHYNIEEIGTASLVKSIENADITVKVRQNMDIKKVAKLSVYIRKESYKVALA